MATSAFRVPPPLNPPPLQRPGNELLGAAALGARRGLGAGGGGEGRQRATRRCLHGGEVARGVQARPQMHLKFRPVF
eukprot:6938698-Pyramimonas_sp.AAC.1